MSDAFHQIFNRAIAEGELSAKFPSARKAANIRQRLYRYRDKLRATPDDPLALLVDELTFELNGATIRIIYRKPEEVQLVDAFLQEKS